MAAHTTRGNGSSSEPGIAVTSMPRRGDSGGTYFRSSRYFAVGHEWFATMRDGSHIGPFNDRGEAELRVAWQLSQRALERAEVDGKDEKPGRKVTPLEVLLEELLACRKEAAAKSTTAACASARQRLDDLESSARQPAQASLKAKAIRLFLAEVDS